LKKNKKKGYIKIGILGGTFDPPHKGHLYISKIALKKLKLNKLIIWKNLPTLQMRSDTDIHFENLQLYQI